MYVQEGILVRQKKNKVIPGAATWMELETLMLSEVSQKEKDKQHMISLIWNLIYGTNEPSYRKETNPWIWRTDCGCQAGGGGSGMDGGCLGLIDADYCLWNELAVRAYCVALGTMSGHL